MNTYYKNIMNYPGIPELQELVRKWDILSDNISRRTFDAPILLPDLLVYTKPGYGNTKVLSLLADYLDSKSNLMSFYGDVKFFEIQLDYCEPNSNFTELYRLIDSINAAAGFRNEYRGIIRINIDEWVGHPKERYFRDFLDFLQENTSLWMVILTISNTEENDLTKEMESVISMFLRIETIKLFDFETDDFISYASEVLAKFGLTADDSAKALLSESLEVLKKNEYFYGLHTVRDMCSDIAYSVFSKSKVYNNILTAEMLEDFSADSEYITRTAHKIKSSGSLGFRA